MNSATLEDIGSILTEAIEEVCRRAAVSRSFRDLALLDPSLALAAVTGQPLPKDLNIQFVDNSGPVKIIPLPTMADGMEQTEDVSEAELRQIRGFDVTGFLKWGR